jgi:mono/diheme cytochrome c family protein
MATGALVLALSPAWAQESRRTIWDGVFNEEQAGRGKSGYTKACAQCHAEDLAGKADAPALVGAAFLGRFDGSTVDDMVLTVRQTMPQDAPNSLEPAAYVDIVTYLLKANGSPAGPQELPSDRAHLQQVGVTVK